MPLMTPMKCWRGRDDCNSLASVETAPEDTTEDQFFELDFIPDSFVCCGCIRPDARNLPQDAYRVCFRNSETDEMTDNDDQDLAHLGHVIAAAQAVIATRRVNTGSIDVIDMDGGIATVETKQKAAK